ncbi:hypothetical protein FQN57_005214 [Myotisia sp. PD_48]|nr:hypothetical protein FQN57_005214 [Myotisia sp. PD_48]
MPPFRNLIPKRLTINVERPPDDPQQPSTDDINNINGTNGGKSPDNRSRPSLSIRRSRDPSPSEYKMSVVSDSGEYLPPSPPAEKKGSWSRSVSRNNSRNLVDENEPFSISRESFDSYRRSFDISARSPISQSDPAASRTSLDSRFSRPTTRSPLNTIPFERDIPGEDEPFDDITLADDSKPKKRGFFSRFGDSSTPQPDRSRSPSQQNHHGFHLPGRRRGKSGQGAELGSMPRDK